MRIEYDKPADALYIRLMDGEHECRAVRLTEEITLDFATGEQLVGIEVLAASRLFDDPSAPTVELRDLLPRILGHGKGPA